jgi:hypothetical protein
MSLFLRILTKSPKPERINMTVVSAPAVSAGSNVKGEGWNLELKSGWKLVPGPCKGDSSVSPPHPERNGTFPFGSS